MNKQEKPEALKAEDDFAIRKTSEKKESNDHFYALNEVPKDSIKEITTVLDWEDLIIDNRSLEDVNDIKRWMKFGRKLMEDWGMSGKINPGYRALFIGPRGSGKKLTASLLGKSGDLPVYRIDLSMIVSKYIGETEKNLSRIFAKVDGQNWILFFDEADSLFGTRTNVQDAHDRYANLETAYLLQGIENYAGLSILSVNNKANIDSAFLRRLQSIIHFPMPDSEMRLKLWTQSFPAQVKLSNDIDLSDIAQQFELSPADIMEVVQYVSLHSIEDGTHTILLRHLMNGIRRIMKKEGGVL